MTPTSPILATLLLSSLLFPLTATTIPPSTNHLEALAHAYEQQGRHEEADQIYRYLKTAKIPKVAPTPTPTHSPVVKPSVKIFPKKSPKIAKIAPSLKVVVPKVVSTPVQPKIPTIGERIGKGYTLLESNQFGDVETLLNGLEGLTFSPQESQELRKLYALYYHKQSSAQLEAKQFNRAEKTAQSGLLMDPADNDLTEALGWSLLNQQRPTEALGCFETLFGRAPSPKIAYSAALCAHNAHAKQKAFDYLKIASMTTDTALLEKIAALYTMMGQPKKSLEIITQLQTPSLAPTLPPVTTPQTDLNGVYNPFLSVTQETKPTIPVLSSAMVELRQTIFAPTQTSFAGGMFVESRTGMAGVDQLRKTVVPLQMTYFPSLSTQIYGGVNAMTLQTGGLENHNRSQLGYGTTQGGNHKIDTLHAIELELSGRLGSTPLNNQITQSTPVGYLQGKWKPSPVNLSLKALQESITETLVSYVGQRDPDTGAVWGQVTRRGVEGSIEHQGVWTTSLTLGYYPSIEGINTLSNGEKKGALLVAKRLKTDTLEGMIGPLMVYDRYDHSTNHFTYGHGGYFSPTSFMLGAIYGDVNQKVNPDVWLRLKGSVGYVSFKEGSSPMYPLDPTTTQTYGSSNTRGFSMNLKGYGDYRLNDHFHLIGMAGYSFAPNYASTFGGLSLIYYFDTPAKFHPAELQRVAYGMDKMY